MSDNEQTLYDRIGGAGALARLIDEFYDRVLADPELAPFFAETSMDKQRRMQREFFAAALDGPQTMSDIDLAYAHHGRGITPGSLQPLCPASAGNAEGNADLGT